jgi:beta-mannosidase
MRLMRFGCSAIPMAIVVTAAARATSGASAPVAPPAPVAVSGGWLLQDAAAVTVSGDLVSSLEFQPPVYRPVPYRPPPTAGANPAANPGQNGEARPRVSSEWTQGPGPPTTGWFRAVVPGTVLTTLVANEVYPEPLFGENNRPTIIPESLSRTSYWYRTTVLVPRAFAGCRVWLTFDGINYTADVWVNGARVGDIRGAFSRGRFDVTAGVTPGQPAAIAVLIHPPTVPADPLEQTQQWGLGLNGGVMSHDGPTFVSTQGWDWIPGIRDRDIGIWQRVTLSASGPAVVRDPYVTSAVAPDRSSADVTVETTVENATDGVVSGIVVGTLGTVAFRSDRLAIPPRGRRVVKMPELHLVHPRLWWPNGFGEAYRYPLHLAFTSDGRTSDVVDLRIGLRSVVYQFGASDALTLVVNGVPVFAQGGNWGMDEALKRIGRDRLDAGMRLQHDAHFTIVRNWVGQSTSEDFYDLADRYGLMVWDEFFQPAAGLDSGRRRGDDGERDVTDVGLYLANAREKVLRFRNHPSIVLWCGRNEGEPSPRALAAGLQSMMAELDPARLYQTNSDAGRGVKSGGPYAWQPPPAYFGEGRDGRAPLVPFKTEIGSVSIPTLESILGMMPAKDAESFPATVNDDWAEHDFAIGGGNNGAGTYLADLAARYGDVRTLPRFVRAAQMADYETLRALFEGRVAQLLHPATAVITWMSQPAQPSTTWQLYSYDLEPFASYFGARKGCEPLHIQLNPRNGRMAIINHQPQLVDGLTYRVRVVDLDGRLILDRSAAVGPVAASAATDAGPVGAPADAPPVQFVRLELFDAGHASVSDNFYWRNVAAENDLTALDLMPTVSVEAVIFRADRAGVVHLDVSLSNRGRAVAVMTHLQLRRQTVGSRVLPVWYSDNYVSLLPGERRSVAIEAAAAALTGDMPLVTIDGWNVTTTRRSFSKGGRSAVAPNDPAIVRPALAPGPR